MKLYLSYYDGEIANIRDYKTGILYATLRPANADTFNSDFVYTRSEIHDIIRDGLAEVVFLYNTKQARIRGMWFGTWSQSPGKATTNLRVDG